MSNYNSDNTLREVIRNFIQTQLNLAANVGGEQKVNFVVGKDFRQISEDLIQVIQVDNTYRTVEDTFTIGMIVDMLGTPEPIKNMVLLRYTIPMSFFVSTENKYDEIKEALQLFVRNLVGNDFDEAGYIFGTNASEITNTGKIQTINGIEYVQMTCNVYITSTENALLGNKVKSYIGEDFDSLIRIYPVGRSTTRSFTVEETQWNNNKETFTLFKESTWNADLTFVIDTRYDLFEKLIEHLENPTLLNKAWAYRIDYSFFTSSVYDKSVGFSSIVNSALIGEYAVFTVTMKISGIDV
jgi:hypothetical protein